MHKNPLSSDTSHDARFSTLALEFMAQHDVSPNPENYAVWFHYAGGRNKPLMQEIDTIIANSMPFTPEIGLYFYNKYVVPKRWHKTAEEAASGTQKMLVEVLKIINDFSGETQNYNKDIDYYLDHITHDVSDEDVKKTLKELIEATTGMKKTGEKMAQKLEAATQEINSLKKNIQQVTNESQRDFLTGVFNRKTFETFTDEQLMLARDSGKELCLFMIDIDHFKHFNDRFGHLMGDEVLKIVGRTLTELLKGRDMVARFGGEEFVVVLPETPIDGAVKVAEMVRTAIASKQLKRKDTGEHFGVITVSAGVARYRAGSDTLPTLIKRADEALYQSKRGGRNRVTKEA